MLPLSFAENFIVAQAVICNSLLRKLPVGAHIDFVTSFLQQHAHMLGPWLLIIFGKRLEFAQMVRVAKAMDAILKTAIRFPSVMNQRSTKMRQNIKMLHRLNPS